MAIDAGPRPRSRGLGWLPWVALAAVWFVTVQVRPMFDPDEGRYAEIPREMVASGDWLTPRLNDLKYFEKPPLQYWATAAAYSAFGVREWTSRVWTVGLAFACLPLVFGWTRRFYGRDAGLAAIVALAVSPYFEIIGHLDLLDAGFSFWLSAAVFAFTLAQSASVGSKGERCWMLAAWVAAALAILSKGIVVGVLAIVTLGVYTLVERDARPWKRLHLGLGLPLFLLVGAPWFIAVSLRNPDFPEFFFVHEHFARFLTTVHQRVEPWWFFLPLLLLGVLPWVASFVGACRKAWSDAGPTPEFKPLKFLIVFCGVTLLFFSASGSKLAPYLQPMFPPLAAIVGAYVAERRGFVHRAARICAGIIIVFCIALAVYSIRRNAFVPDEAIAWSIAAIVAILVAVVVTWRVPRPGAAGGALVTAAAGILAWQLFLMAFAVVPPTHSARDLVAAVKPYVHPQTELFSVGQYRETVSPYLQRTLILVGFEGELQFGLHAEPGKQMATSADFVARWRSSTDAVAFLDPRVWDEYRRNGLPGRVIGADDKTVAVSRL